MPGNDPANREPGPPALQPVPSHRLFEKESRRGKDKAEGNRHREEKEREKRDKRETVADELRKGIKTNRRESRPVSGQNATRLSCQPLGGQKLPRTTNPAGG